MKGLLNVFEKAWRRSCTDSWYAPEWSQCINICCYTISIILALVAVIFAVTAFYVPIDLINILKTILLYKIVFTVMAVIYIGKFIAFFVFYLIQFIISKIKESANDKQGDKK